MYNVIHINQSWVVDEEWMGTKEKFWISLPPHSELWLFKHSRVSGDRFAGEHWSEKLASEIAKALGIPCADVELACYNGQPGSLSRRFRELDQGVTLVHGNEILAGAVAGYDQTKIYGHNDHTFANILAAVDVLMPSPESKADARIALGGLIVLDALILNVDRHHENWCVFRESEAQALSHRVGPSFDHASSLGRELAPKKLDDWFRSRVLDRAEKYASKARGAIYWNSEADRGTNPLELVKNVHQTNPDVVAPWLERLSGLDIETLCGMLNLIPAGFIDEPCRIFTAELLRHTHAELTGITQ